MPFSVNSPVRSRLWPPSAVGVWHAAQGQPPDTSRVRRSPDWGPRLGSPCPSISQRGIGIIGLWAHIEMEAEWFPLAAPFPSGMRSSIRKLCIVGSLAQNGKDGMGGKRM